MKGARFHLAALMVIGGLATMALPLGQAERTGFSPEGIQFFESKIRPLLVNNFHECHGNEPTCTPHEQTDAQICVLVKPATTI